MSVMIVLILRAKTARPMKDVLGVPESLFMLFDTIVAFDHFFQVVKIITYVPIPAEDADVEAEYRKGQEVIKSTIATLLQERTPLPQQGPIIPQPGVHIQHWPGRV